MSKYIFRAGILLCFISCNNLNNSETETTKVAFVKKGKYIVKEVSTMSGKLISRQYMNRDTIADGAMSLYYENGTISEWRWYPRGYDTPETILYYDENGVFDTLYGTSILYITCCNDENHVVVMTINPPQVGIRLRYKTFLEGKCTFDVTHRPILTDSVGWFILNDRVYDKTQTHRLYFYVVDSVQRTLYYQDSLDIVEG